MRNFLLFLLPCLLLTLSACEEDPVVPVNEGNSSFAPGSNLSFTIDGEETTYRFGYKTEFSNEGSTPRSLVPYQQRFLLTADDVLSGGTLSGVSDVIFLSIGRQRNQPFGFFRWDIDDAYNFPVVDGEVFSTGLVGYKDYNFETRENSGFFSVSGGVLIFSYDGQSDAQAIYVNADAGQEGNKLEGKWTGVFRRAEF